jgi:hypothetical protein
MLAREAARREASPTARVIDNQSAKTTEAGGSRGYDAVKKINCCKRRIVVDTSRIRSHLCGRLTLPVSVSLPRRGSRSRP